MKGCTKYQVPAWRQAGNVPRRLRSKSIETQWKYPPRRASTLDEIIVSIPITFKENTMEIHQK